MPGLPPGCAIHRADAADLAAFGDISRRTFLDTYRQTHAPEALARHVDAQFHPSRLQAELGDPQRLVLAVTHDGAWVAYALLREGDAPPAVGGARPLEVERFYVDAPWQGRGVAAPLMDAVVGAARQGQHDRLWLAVWTQNPRARRFYEKQGFLVAGSTTYIFDGVAELDALMSRAI